MKLVGIDLTDTSIYFPKDITHTFVQERLSILNVIWQGQKVYEANLLLA